MNAQNGQGEDQQASAKLAGDDRPAAVAPPAPAIQGNASETPDESQPKLESPSTHEVSGASKSEPAQPPAEKKVEPPVAAAAPAPKSEPVRPKVQKSDPPPPFKTAPASAAVKPAPRNFARPPQDAAQPLKDDAARPLKEDAAPPKLETEQTGKPRKKSVLPLATVVGVALIGGWYYLSTRDGAPDISSAPADTDAAKPTVKAAAAPPDASSAESVKTEAAPPESAKIASDRSEAAKPDVAPTPSEPSAQNEAPPAKEAETPASAPPPAVVEKAEPAPASPAGVKAEAAPAKADAADGPSVRERELVEHLVDTRAELSDTQAQVAQTQTQLLEMTRRLAAAEAKLNAPKEPPEVASTRAADAAARVVLAESALAALRQGGDAAALIGGLERLGGDADRIAQMRAGLSTPTLAKLTAEFSALSPRIVAAAAPPPPPQQSAEDAAKSPGEKVITYLETHASKLVKLRAAGPTAPAVSPEDQAAAHVAKALKLLNAGDLAGAVAEQAMLPEASRAVTADWASAANVRLAAEGAARAEFEAALRNVAP
ncbi:hypothetical protein CCR94_11190 [Rhodoblastus sphagnicola]|uniref:Uncharacterized protein n=1 Tax=Rhodoblastus sphagnicola TaxID=333368 RepID=A0A2S6N883_9HYPH|nr:hypothetical protein [Rhodoblastus sphagnicola]MBB4196762.1 hypothetical protein [Rhodoblastus sphagnicola]PPQ30823.1 hypothetical protein CCR94_11190 [Rhodoblastus sphagnicola]